MRGSTIQPGSGKLQATLQLQDSQAYPRYRHPAYSILLTALQGLLHTRSRTAQFAANTTRQDTSPDCMCVHIVRSAAQCKQVYAVLLHATV